MCCGRCGGESVCRMRLCRKTECPQASPDTPLLCWCRRTAAWEWHSFGFCGWLRIYHGTPDSRTHHSDQSSCRHLALSFWFSCRPLQYSPSPPSPPPSNISQSALLYTAPGASGWTSVDGLGRAALSAAPSLFCCPQTEPEFYLLCLGPVWVWRHLRETIRWKK